GAFQLSRQKPVQRNRNEIERFLIEKLFELFIYSPEKSEEIQKMSQALRFDLSGYKSVMLIKGNEKKKKKWEQCETVIRRKIFEILPSSLTAYKEGVFCVVTVHHRREEIGIYSKRLYKRLAKLLHKKNGKN